MCGIFGIVTKQEKILGPTLIDAGHKLSYRGYDTVGAATIPQQGQIDLRKDKGRVQEVADKFTPTKFKAKFSEVFGDDVPQVAVEDEEDEDVPIESLTFNMEWDEDAKEMLEQVPSPFRKVAVENTENYAKEHSNDKVSVAVFDAFRKELGM